MKTLVIPDIHQRTELILNTLEKESYDEAVFLGDWLDSYFEPPKVTSFEKTCETLRELVLEHPRRENFVFLVGNHDMNYIFNNVGSSHKSHTVKTEYFSSGYTKNKCKLFRKVFWDAGLRDSFFIEHFKPAYKTQGWTLSHAGFIPEVLPYMVSLDKVLEEILPETWKNFRNVGFIHNYLISAVGLVRGGSHPVGGVFWLDWHYEMTPHKATGNQVVGHTTVAAPHKAVSDDGKAVCWNLDTEKHYGIIENEQVYIRTYADLK